MCPERIIFVNKLGGKKIDKLFIIILEIHTCRSPGIPFGTDLIGIVQVRRKHLFLNIFVVIIGPRTLSRFTVLKLSPYRSIK